LRTVVLAHPSGSKLHPQPLSQRAFAKRLLRNFRERGFRDKFEPYLLRSLFKVLKNPFLILLFISVDANINVSVARRP
jgi:hypothetical protein